MKLMSEKQQKKWKKMRSKGFNSFVIRSILLFGIVVPLAQLIVEYIFDEKRT